MFLMTDLCRGVLIRVQNLDGVGFTIRVNVSLIIFESINLNRLYSTIY